MANYWGVVERLHACPRCSRQCSHVVMETTYIHQGEMMRNRIKNKARSVVCMSALTSVMLIGPALAAEINLSGLGSAPTHQAFIVTYRAQPGSGDATALQAHELVLNRSLAAAARALPAPNGRPLGLAKVRELAAGPTLVRAERALDRIESEQLMRALAADPAVAHVEVDQMLQPAWTPNDPSLPLQWGLIGTHGINAPAAWKVSRGAGTVIAVVDTGSTSHPDLNADTLAGYDFISDTTSAGDGGGRDADPSDPGDFSGIKYSSWHGTHVAGIAAAVTHNATGMAGVAPEAKIVHARVLGRGGGALSDVSDAILWAAGGSVPGVPANPHPAEVINLSLGGYASCGTAMQNAVNGAVAQGATVVAAAGNDTVNVAGFTPANCANVVAVASTDSTGARSWFSNYGAGVHLAAPGSAIHSTLNSGLTTPASPTYGNKDGTSMAAPHVAGVVALMQAASASPLTPGQVSTILKNTATPITVSPSTPIGAGIVNAHHAVLAAARQLERGIPMRGLSGSVQHWTVTVPSLARNLVIRIEGGTGEADLYVRKDTPASLADYGCRPYLAGNQEACTYSRPASGTYHVMVHSRSGLPSYDGVTLQAAWESLSDQPVVPIQPGLPSPGFP